MIGLRATMYAIVKKVTSPPRTSWAIEEPLSEILKYESSMNKCLSNFVNGGVCDPVCDRAHSLWEDLYLMCYLVVIRETTPRDIAID